MSRWRGARLLVLGVALACLLAVLGRSWTQGAGVAPQRTAEEEAFAWAEARGAVVSRHPAAAWLPAAGPLG